MNSFGKFVKEFVLFVKENKKIWLIPVVLLLAIFGLVVILAQSQALAPFIYSLF
jgi:cytochrome c-type biogenesis protein CcmH/NrfF